MLARRLSSLLVWSLFVVVAGCNAILGTEDIQFVAPAAKEVPAPATGGDDDGSPGGSSNPASDAQVSDDAGSEEGLDAGSNDNSDASAGGFEGGGGGSDV
jgi:hypothetical protein